MYEKIHIELQKEIAKLILPKYTNQKEYTQNNNEINISSDKQISRSFLCEAEFLIKEIR